MVVHDGCGPIMANSVVIEGLEVIQVWVYAVVYEYDVDDPGEG